MPELCIEVVSTDRVYDRVTRRLIYTEAGVRKFWVVETRVTSPDPALAKAVYPANRAFGERRGEPVLLERSRQARMERDPAMTNPYVEDRDGELHLTLSRVTLASVVQAFLDGQTAESIAQSFPTLQLEQVYGATAHYLANREEIDRRLAGEATDFEVLRRSAREKDPAFYQKLADFRRSTSVGPR